MTNREKAEELRRYVCNPCMPNGEDALGILNRTNRWKADLRNIWEVCERTALEMAEWKDQQFKEYLEEKKRCLSFRSDWSAYENTIYNDCLAEIINELFKEE